MQLAPVLVLGLIFGSGGLLGETTDTVDETLPLGDQVGRDAIFGSLDKEGYRSDRLDVEVSVLDGEQVALRLPDTSLETGDLQACIESRAAAAATCIDDGLLLRDPRVVTALVAGDPTLRLLCPDIANEPCQVPLWILLGLGDEEEEETDDPYAYTGATAAEVPPAEPFDLDTPTILVGAAVPVMGIAIVGALWPHLAGAATAAGTRIPVWLRYLGAAALYSRITGDRLLENETRSHVDAFIDAHPGASIHEVQEAVGVAWGTAVYHLSRMERHGHMVSMRDGNHRRYWKAGTKDAMRREAMAILRTDTARKLARAVQAHPGIKQKELCEKVGIRNPVASKYLKRLHEQKLIRQEPQGRYRCYFPTSTMAKVLAPKGTPTPNAHRIDGGARATDRADTAADDGTGAGTA